MIPCIYQSALGAALAFIEIAHDAIMLWIAPISADVEIETVADHCQNSTPATVVDVLIDSDVDHCNDTIRARSANASSIICADAVRLMPITADHAVSTNIFNDLTHAIYQAFLGNIHHE